jgi:hypothetical protein
MMELLYKNKARMNTRAEKRKIFYFRKLQKNLTQRN